MKLNLGCGIKKIDGYVNCDISQQVKPDFIFDIEHTLPFNDDSADEIVLIHVLEHVKNFVPLLHELWRVCTKNAKIHVRVPFYASLYAFIDPTHVRFFTPFTFDYFSANTECGHEVGNQTGLFKVNVKIDYCTPVIKHLFNPLININQKVYCRFFANIFPAGELIYTLTVVK